MNAVVLDPCPYIRRRASHPARTTTRPLATLAETGGHLAVFDVTFLPGAEPPAHIHHTFAEGIFMLQGRLDGWVGETALLIRTGEMAVLPRATPRYWQVMAGAEGIARGLMVFAPGAVGAHTLFACELPTDCDIDWMPNGYQPRIQRLSTPKPCFHLPGETLRPLVLPEETGGMLTSTLWMTLGPSRKAPHRHASADEALYVLDGAVVVEAGGWSATAYPGDFVFLPRGVLHSHHAVNDGTAQVLLIQAPGAPSCTRLPVGLLSVAEPALA